METSKRETLFLHPAGQRDELHRLLHSEAYLGLTYISAVPNTLFGAGNALFFTILGWSLLFLLLSAGGRFCCGTLYLQSGAALEIAAGAVLLASPDIADYPANTHHNRYRNEPELDRCFLYAQDAARITLRGPGAIDGSAAAFPNAGDPGRSRPMLLRFLRCEDIRLEGLGLYNAAAWTVACLDSRRIWATGLDIENHDNYNGDGLDFDGCEQVFVQGCRIIGTDDNLCLQSSGRPMRDVHITGCHFSSVCAGIRIGLKSIGEIRSVVISDCTMREVWREGIKIECTEGGAISDILVRNVTMHNVRRPIFAILNNRYRPDDLGSSVELNHMPPIGRLERLQFKGITAVDDETMTAVHRRFGNDVMGEPRFGGCRLDAHPDHPIRDVLIEDLWYTAVGGADPASLPPDSAYPPVPDRLREPDVPGSENYWPDWSRTTHLDARNVRGLTLRGLRLRLLHPDPRPALRTEGCTPPETTDPGLLTGRQEVLFMLPITLKIVAADGRIRQAATAEGPVHLIYRAPYEPGDRLVLDAGAPGRHLVVQLEDTMPPALLYGAEAQLCFPVPFGDAAIVYSPKAFSGDCHVLRARPAAPAEVAARRSLAFNPYDLHQPTGWYPHARANVETRGEAVFAARNAIDGVWENDGHGLWPWQSWGINRDPNAALTVEFGRPVRVEEIRLTLRADFPHDSWWTAATAAFSDGSRERLSLRKTAAPQTFVIPPRTVTRLTLCELQKADDESPFPALTQLEVWGTESPV